MRTSLRFLLFSLLSALGNTPSASAKPTRSPVHVQGYTREVLFSIPVGNKSQNIGVGWQPTEYPDGQGVCGLRVCGGRIYVGDSVNRAVKVFDLQGRYVARNQGNPQAPHGQQFERPQDYWLRTRGPIEALRTLVVNQRREVFTLSGAGYDTISKFSPSGKLAWSVGQHDTLAGSSNDSFHSLIYPSPGGGVAVGIVRYIKPIPPQNRLAWLDKQGKLVKIVDADFADEKGFYTFEKAPHSPSFTGTLRAFDGNGRTLFTRQLGVTSKIKSLFSDAVEDSNTGLDRIYSSPSGTFYSVSQIILSARSDVRPNNEARPYNTGLHAVVIPYASSGQPLGALRFLSPPFGDFDPVITMDEHNNVYTVEYVPNKVRVVRYKWKGTTKR